MLVDLGIAIVRQLQFRKIALNIFPLLLLLVFHFLHFIFYGLHLGVSGFYIENKILKFLLVLRQLLRDGSLQLSDEILVFLMAEHKSISAKLAGDTTPQNLNFIF